MADFSIRDIADSGDQTQPQIAREAFASRAHPRQELGRYLRRGYRIVLLDTNNVPLRDANNHGFPGRVLLAAAGTLVCRFIVVSADGRPLDTDGTIAGSDDRDLTAAEQAILPDDPLVLIHAHPDLTLTLGAQSGVGQAIARLDGSAVPRAEDEVGYRFQTGLGSVNTAAGVAATVSLAGIGGVGHLLITRVAGSTGDVFVYFEVLDNPVPGLGVTELRLAAAIP